MRRPRIKAVGAGTYHCMSRIIERRPIFKHPEMDHFHRLMRDLAGFGGLDILSYALMSNHFHILLHVPERIAVTDEELIVRLHFLYTPKKVEVIASQLHEFRRHKLNEAAEDLKAHYTYRMYDVSEFFKALKQRFSQYYNKRAQRSGPLWEQRFKSILVERSEQALSTMAAYIDLNPVRAGLVTDPKEYRFSGYGEAVAGGKEARAGLCRLMETVRGYKLSWDETQRAYRQHLYIQGRQKGVDAQGKPIRQGFTPEQVQEVLAAGGQLPMHELLRCRVRYFSDGLALGSREFVEEVFQRYRGHFGARRQSGAAAMRHGDWGGLCTMRNLRKQPVTHA